VEHASQAKIASAGWQSRVGRSPACLANIGRRRDDHSRVCDLDSGGQLGRVGSVLGSTSLAQSVRFQSGTGVARPRCGTKRERSTSSIRWM
jgi:hypothetical protein